MANIIDKIKDIFNQDNDTQNTQTTTKVDNNKSQTKIVSKPARLLTAIFEGLGNATVDTANKQNGTNYQKVNVTNNDIVSKGISKGIQLYNNINPFVNIDIRSNSQKASDIYNQNKKIVSSVASNEQEIGDKLVNKDGTWRDFDKEISKILGEKNVAQMAIENNLQLPSPVSYKQLDEYDDQIEELKQLKSAQEALKENQQYDYYKNSGNADEFSSFEGMLASKNDTFVERRSKGLEKTFGDLATTVAGLFDGARDLLGEGAGRAVANISDSLYKNGTIDEDSFNYLQKKAKSFIDYDANDEDSIGAQMRKDMNQLALEIQYGTGSVEKFIGEGLDSTANFLIQYALLGGTGSLVSMGLQSGTGKYYENLENGYDQKTALLNGALTGLISFGTEKIGMDNFVNTISGGAGEMIAGHAAEYITKSILTQGAAEGLEEVVEGNLDYALDAATAYINGQPVPEYNAGEIFYSFLVGGFSGALMGGVGGSMYAVTTQKSYNALQNDMNSMIEIRDNIKNGKLSATPEQLNNINNNIQMAQVALSKFDAQADNFTRAIKLESDIPEANSNLSQVKKNLTQALKPSVEDALVLNDKINGLENNMAKMSQALLSQKGLNIDAKEYSQLDEQTRKSVDTTQKYANELGAKVGFSTNLVGSEGNIVDGVYHNGTIIINPNSKQGALSTLIHELTHGTESSKYYGALSELARENFGEGVDNALEKLKQRYSNLTELDDDGAMKELTAITTQELLGNEEYVDRLVRYNNSLATRIYEGIKQLVTDTNTAQDIAYNFERAFADKKAVAQGVANEMLELSKGTKLEDLREKDLMVIHNLTEPKLMGLLDLGGIPMPSIAITKDSIGHKGYGDISLLFDKNTIDPKNGKNEVFSNDAYTTRFPRIEYEISSSELHKIFKRLTKIDGFDAVRNETSNLRRLSDTENASELLQNNSGSFVEAFRDNNAMKYLYLSDIGQKQEIPTMEKNLSRITDNDGLRYIIEKVGGKKIMDSVNSEDVRAIGKEVQNAISEYNINKYGDSLLDGSVNPETNEMYFADLDELVYQARNLIANEASWKRLDMSTLPSIVKNVDQAEYEKWLNEVFGDVNVKSGIWNGKDLFYPDGTRRSFSQLHNPYTLENVFKTMKRESGLDSRAKESWASNSTGGMIARMSKAFNSIDEIIQNEGLIVNEDAAANAKEEVRKQLDKLEADMVASKMFFEYGDQYEVATEFLGDVITKNNTDSMWKVLQEEYDSKISREDAEKVFNEILEAKKATLNVPTDYFEAKPRRIVDFSEVQTAVIPSDASEELKTRLNELGINTVEYDKSVEGARQEAVRAQDNLKFSEGMTLEDLKKDNKWVEDTQQVLDEVNGQSQDGEILTVDNIDDILHQRPISQRTLDSIRRTEKIMVDEADKWIKGYDTIRAEYPIFSKNVLNNALYDVLINGDLRPEVRDAMANTLSSEYSFEGINGDIQKDIDEFIKESLETFNNEAKYEAGEIDTESVRRSMAQNEALNQKDIEGSFEAQQRGAALNRMSADIKRDYQAEYQPIVEDLLKNDSAIRETKGKRSDAKVSNWKTMDQNIFALANGNKELYDTLKRKIRYECLDNAASTKATMLQNAQTDVINKIKDLGIVAGSEESAALQYILEGHTEVIREDIDLKNPEITQETINEYKNNPYVPFTEKELKLDYDYEMANGKKAWENILEAKDILKNAYDDVYARVTNSQIAANGDVEGNADYETNKLLIDVNKAFETLEKIKDEIKKNGSKESTQAAFEIAKRKYNQLVKQYNARISKDENGDLTRRQLTPYRENYSHHIVKNSVKSTFESIKNADLLTPTELAGISDYTNPNTAWASFSAAQDGGKYVPDAVSSFASYMKEASDVVAYNPVILELRQFNKDIKATAQGTQLNKFSEYLNDYCNMLAGKRNNFDRGFQKLAGAKAMRTITALNSYAKAAALTANIRSGLVQFANIPNGLGILQQRGGKGYIGDVAKGIKGWINSFGNTGTSAIDQSSFMTNRYFDFDTGKTGAGQTVKDIADGILTIGDKVGAETIWWSAYAQGERLNVENPVLYADDVTRSAIAGRTKEDMALAMQSQVINLFVPFQVENNNLYQTLKQQGFSGKGAAVATYTVAAFLFNCIIKGITGGDDEVLPEFITPIYEEITKALKGEEVTDDVVKNAFWGEIGEMISLTPLGEQVLSLAMDSDTLEALFGDYNPSRYGMSNIGLAGIGNIIEALNEDNTRAAVADAITEFIGSYVKGGKQITRTVGGLQSMGGLPKLNGDGEIEISPINYSKSGKIAYVNDQSSLSDWIKAALFGKWNTSAAKGYIDSGFKTMSKTAQNIYEALQASIGKGIENYDQAKEYQEAKANKEEISLRDELIAKGTYKDYINEVAKKYEDYIDNYGYANEEDSPKSFAQFANSYGITADDLKQDTYQNFYDTYSIDKDTQKVFSDAMDIKNVENALGKTIANSGATLRRVAYEEAGIYDQILEYIDANALDYDDFGLTKTVVGYDSSKINSMLQKINAATGSNKTYGDGKTTESKAKGSTKSSTKKKTSTSKSGLKLTGDRNIDEKKILAYIGGLMSNASSNNPYKGVSSILNKTKSGTSMLNEVKSNVNAIKKKYQ